MTGHVAGAQKRLWSCIHSTNPCALQPGSEHVPAGNAEGGPGFPEGARQGRGGAGAREPWEPGVAPQQSLKMLGETGPGAGGGVPWRVWVAGEGVWLGTAQQGAREARLTSQGPSASANVTGRPERGECGERAGGPWMNEGPPRPRCWRLVEGSAGTGRCHSVPASPWVRARGWQPRPGEGGSSPKRFRPHPCVFCKEPHKRGPDWKSIL